MEAVKAAHSRKARVFATMNALYTAGQYEMLLRELDNLAARPAHGGLAARFAAPPRTRPGGAGRSGPRSQGTAWSS